jgi:hypothetical protein
MAFRCELRQSEIEGLGMPVFCNEYVGGFDVAMNDLMANHCHLPCGSENERVASGVKSNAAFSRNSGKNPQNSGCPEMRANRRLSWVSVCFQRVEKKTT